MNQPKSWTPEEQKACRTKIGAAGMTLVATAPHFGLAWAHMRPRAKVPSATRGGTWEVDNKGVMYADPHFTATLSAAQAQFVLAHEIMHVLGGHFERAIALGLIDSSGKITPGKEQEIDVWGQATDMAINNALRADKIGDAPKDALFPPQEYLDQKFRLDAESIFFWLLKNPQHQQGGGQGQPQPGGQPGGKAPGAGCLPIPSPDGAGASEGQAPGQAGDKPGQGPSLPAIDWKEVARGVEALARQLGGKFAGKGSAVADLLAPTPSRTDWRKLCRQGFEHVSSEAEERSIRSFSRIARRPEVTAGILRPGHIGTEGTLAGVCDVSGSIGRETVAKIAGHMLRICRQFPTVKVIFVAHTDQVVYAKVLKAGGSIADIMEGLKHSGGTAAQPAYEEVLKLNKGRKVDTLIHFTDGYIEHVWPDVPAKQLIVGQCGDGQGGTPKPHGARIVPIHGAHE